MYEILVTEFQVKIEGFCSIVDRFVRWIKSLRCFFIDAFLDSIDREKSNFYLNSYIGSKKIFDGYFCVFYVLRALLLLITLKPSPAVRKTS